jgi:predicted metal-binding membrane protein
MTPAARERVRVRVPLLSISGAAWLLLALEPNGMAMPAYCSAATLGTMPALSSVATLLALTSPASLAAGWALMLVAMMVPTLIGPVRHVRDRSFARRRVRAVMLFAAAYAAIWMAAGMLLLETAMVLRLVVPETMLLWSAILVASVWQCSPAKQRCLNRCHAWPALPAFGSAADAGALRFGLMQGIWCVGSCWALMLLPVLVVGWHVAAMAAVALWLCAERFDTPAPPRWRFRVPAKALRIALAQARTLAVATPAFVARGSRAPRAPKRGRATPPPRAA